MVACQAPLSMQFSQQEYWSGLPCLPPGDFPNSGIKTKSPSLQAFLKPQSFTNLQLVCPVAHQGAPQVQLAPGEAIIRGRSNTARGGEGEIPLFVTPWTVAHQASLSIGFSQQEYWSGLPFPPLGDLPNPGIEPMSSCISCIGKHILYH